MWQMSIYFTVQETSEYCFSFYTLTEGSCSASLFRCQVELSAELLVGFFDLITGKIKTHS